MRIALAAYDSVGIIERGMLGSLSSRGSVWMDTLVDANTRAGHARARPAALSILIGALLGVNWAAGFRAFMAEIAGAESTFGWYATFVAVLGGAGIVGGLLGWADHIRRTGGRPHWRWLALSPLILGLLPLTVPGTLAALARGIGTAGMAVALIAIGLGYAFGGQGHTGLRVAAGVFSAAAAVALVAFTPLISEGRISFADPRGAWAGTLALGSIIVLGLATSIPFRPVLPLRPSADAPPTVLKDRAPDRAPGSVGWFTSVKDLNAKIRQFITG